MNTPDQKQFRQAIKQAVAEVLSDMTGGGLPGAGSTRSQVKVTPTGDYFTNETLAEHLGISTATLARWRRLKSGPRWAKVGHRVLFRRKDVEDWLASRSVTPEVE